MGKDKYVKKSYHSKEGGIVTFNDTCRNENCIWNVHRICKNNKMDKTYCISYTNK